MTVNPGLAYGFKTKNGRTPLHTACLHGHLDILKLFVAKLDSTRLRVCLDAVDSCGNTPFSECVLADHLKIVEYVMTSLRSFVDLSHRDSLQNSFIHLMAQSGSISCLKYLFGMFYCEVNDKLELVDKFSQDLNRFKMTPLHSACKVIKTIYLRVFSWIVYNYFLYAYKNNKPEIVEYLLERLGKEAGSERIRELINQKDEHDRSSLDIVKSARCHQILDMFNKFQAF
jgi:ankyrin repeat protein